MHVDCDDALCWLRGRPPAEADAVITDPPYSSGGLFRSDRGRPPSEKYQQDKTIVDYGEFSGDAKDGRSWTSWCAEWLDLCRRAVKPGGYVLSFVDWRQLPSLTDAMQWSGLVWRGIVAWDKGRGARAPHKGYFKHQCEYVVWGTAGRLPPAQHDGPFDGCMSVAVRPREKRHIAGKPVELMRRLVRIVPPGGLILDPFAGSGTTGVACALEGRRFAGCEMDLAMCSVANFEIQKVTADGA